MVRSLSASVGVPPVVLTVTFSLMVSVSVTALPAPRSPLEGDSVNRADRRRRGVDLRAGLGQAAQRQVGGIAGTVGNRGAVESDRGCRQCSGVLPGRHRVAEGQHIAGAADITGGAEIVERQRRRAAGGVDGHVLAHGERQRDGLAGTEVAARRRFRQRG